MGRKKFNWTYFGEDVSKVVSINEMIGDKGQRLETSGMLQEAARALRQPYIDYIGKLDIENNSLMWWASSVSEKSPYRSKNFLYICWIKIFQDILLKYSKDPIVFFVEKKAVRHAILKNVPIDNFEVIEDFEESTREAIKNLKEFISYKGWFLLSNIYRVSIARHFYRKQKGVGPRKPSVLIHTWVDERSFDDKGSYRENYFGNLPDYLRKSGKNVVIVPHLLSTGPYRKIVDSMSKSKDVFLLPHSLLSIRDVISVFFTTLVNVPQKLSFPKFEDMDISEVINDGLKNDWVGTYVAFDLLIYRFVRRLKEKGYSVDTMLYPYENQIWERVLCTAMRRFFPHTYLIGYQHSSISRMYLNYFISKLETDIIPFPDRVVTNGKYTRDLFVESGYPAKKVVQGGAVRYTYLLESKISARHREGSPVVLVTPSIGMFEAMELIWKVLKAFEHRNDYRVLIKCHPDMPFERISEHLRIKLPDHFTVSDSPFADLLKGSDVLIYTYSTTCIEAIASGIPAVHVESDLTVDLDPLDFYPGAGLSARNPEEIVKGVEEAITMDEKELSRKRKIWSDVVRNLFGSVDDSVYRLFSK
jgi:hypothetical protein